MLFQKLDTNKIGEIVLRIPLISYQLHHKRISSTIRDYVFPDDNHLEGQFVRDLFVLTTNELIDKWFDGEEKAAELIIGLQSRD